MAALVAERADDLQNLLCCVEALGRPCTRKATVLIHWSINRPNLKACTQHALGHVFMGLVPFARIKLPKA